MLEYRLEVFEKCRFVITDNQTKRFLYFDTFKGLAKNEWDAAQDLARIHRKSSGGHLDTLTFNTIDCTFIEALGILEKLIPKASCFFRKTKLQKFVQKNASIFWTHDESQNLFSPFFVYNFQNIPLEKLDLLTPSFAIYSGEVFPIQTSVSWKLLEIFIQGPKILQGALIKKFLDEDPIIQTIQKPSVVILPLPELVLTDYTGCFANLRFAYGDQGSVYFDDLQMSFPRFKRDPKEEKSFEKDLLEAGFIAKHVEKSRYFCSGDKMFATLQFLLELGWKIIGPDEKLVVMQTSSDIVCKEGRQNIVLSGHLSFGSEKMSLGTICAQKGHFAKLPDQKLGLIDRKSLPIALGVIDGDEVFVPRQKLMQVFDFKGLHLNFSEKLQKMKEGFQSAVGFPEIQLPKEFCGTLMDFQMHGVRWLNFLYSFGFAGLLADDMGLGKTVQILAFLSLYGKNLPTLVVAPSSLVYQWKSEVERFLPNYKVSVWHEGLSVDDFESQIVICSYATLRTRTEFFASLDFEFVVLDEANYIKTRSTQTFQSAIGLNGNFKIALSGTPIENRLDELISLFTFLLPDFSLKGSLDLRSLIRPFVLRRKKEDVLQELPEKIEQIVWVGMNEKQKELYDQTLHEAKNGILQKVKEDGLSMHRMEVLETILRLRQICLDPRLISKDIAGDKIDLLMEEIGNGKALVFSQFTSMLDLVQERLISENIAFERLDGSVQADKRQSIVERFQNDPSIKVFLMSLKAGSVGLNLTSADVVFILDPWWNNAAEEQAISRAHRKGQKNTVLAKRYLTLDSIEEKMLKLKNEKSTFADLLLDQADGSVSEEFLLTLLT